MSREERLEKLRLEYQLYEGIRMNSVEEVQKFIADAEEYFDDVMFSTNLERNIDKIKKVAAKVLGDKCYKYGYMTPTEYNIDISLLELEEALCIGSNIFFQRLATNVTEDNVMDISKLVQFTQDKCESDIARLENYRKTAKEKCGYGVNSLFEEPLNFEILNPFFDSEMANVSQTSSLKQYQKNNK